MLGYSRVGELHYRVIKRINDIQKGLLLKIALSIGLGSKSCLICLNFGVILLINKSIHLFLVLVHLFQILNYFFGHFSENVDKFEFELFKLQLGKTLRHSFYSFSSFFLVKRKLLLLCGFFVFCSHFDALEKC